MVEIVLTDELNRLWVLHKTAKDWADGILLNLHDLGAEFPSLRRLTVFLQDVGFELEPRYPDDYPYHFVWIDARRDLRLTEVCELPPDVFYRGEDEVRNPDRTPRYIGGFFGSLWEYLVTEGLVSDVATSLPDDLVYVLARDQELAICRDARF